MLDDFLFALFMLSVFFGAHVVAGYIGYRLAQPDYRGAGTSVYKPPKVKKPHSTQSAQRTDH